MNKKILFSLTVLPVVCSPLVLAATVNHNSTTLKVTNSTSESLDNFTFSQSEQKDTVNKSNVDYLCATKSVHGQSMIRVKTNQGFLYETYSSDITLYSDFNAALVKMHLLQCCGNHFYKYIVNPENLNEVKFTFNKELCLNQFYFKGDTLDAFGLLYRYFNNSDIDGGSDLIYQMITFHKCNEVINFVD